MTIAPASAARSSTAILADVRSSAAHQHQTKLRLHRAAWLAAASLKQLQDWSAPCRAGFLSDLTPLRSTCRGFGPGLFHSHRFAAIHRLSRSGSVFPPCGQTRVHSLRFRACKPFGAHTVPTEQTHQYVAHRVKHHHRLSSSLTCCINKCQQARTDNCHSVTRGEKCKPL